ncbi:DEAD/DEAH box helicase [Candidatus Woesearchaeota archaeon]|nr:DEAD/DEAH box helicase [Candidatus Woesearchaeota archaeon]
MKFKDFTLDPFQEDAIKAIENNYSVVVSAPTGSGKTLIADFIIEKHRNDDKRIIYTAPIKALSNQKYKDFSHEYGEDKVGLMTGDVVINPHAKILIMTTEIYRNMVVSQDEDIKNIAYVIFDEIHYINDIERGYVWEESIIYSLETVRFLCLSATIPNAEEFASWIQAIKKHPVKVVLSTNRNVPLEHQFYDYELGVTNLKAVKEAVEMPEYRKVMRKRGNHLFRTPEPSHVDLIKELNPDKLPCLFFSFSRKDCQEKALELARRNLFPRNPKLVEYANKRLADAPADVNKLRSTIILKETLVQGIAFHHAGVLPVLKEIVEDLFGQGLIKVLYATETFAVGINMPAKTVCFNSLRKYDGYNFRYLNTKEYFQIAGRAGRRGIDKVGYAISMIHRPTFNYEEIRRITSKDIEPIKSQFKLSVNTVLNLIEQKTPKEIEYILRLSFFSYQKFGKNYANVPTTVLLARYESILRRLRKYHFVENEKLTEKGHFASKIFADEITTGEIFATEVAEELDEYQILLTIGALAYEPREMNKFKQLFRNESLKKLKNILSQSEILTKEKKFLELDTLTTLLNPIYNGRSFFEVLQLTNLLEGDLIRIYTQILDRLGQIRKASTNSRLLNKIENCEGILERALEGIYLIG